MTYGTFVLYSKCSQIKAHCDCLHSSNPSYTCLIRSEERRVGKECVP